MKNNLGFIGGICWILLGFLLWDGGMQKENYLIWLFLAAPLFLSACALRAIGFSLVIQNISLPLGGLLALSFFFPVGSTIAVILTLPWLFFALWLTLQKIRLWWPTKVWDLDILKVLAPLFMIVGAIWATLYRANIQPLEFDPTITLLTAVHFHYAGLILMSLASHWLKQFSNSHQKIFPLLFLISIPLLAIGISISHFHGPSRTELIAATMMAGTAMIFAILNIVHHLKLKSSFGRKMILASSLMLCAGMSLALMFAWKNVLGIDWISIPWMYAIHGTINSVGFALLGVIGTSFDLREQAAD